MRKLLLAAHAALVLILSHGLCSGMAIPPMPHPPAPKMPKELGLVHQPKKKSLQLSAPRTTTTNTTPLLTPKIGSHSMTPLLADTGEQWPISLKMQQAEPWGCLARRCAESDALAKEIAALVTSRARRVLFRSSGFDDVVQITQLNLLRRAPIYEASPPRNFAAMVDIMVKHENKAFNEKLFGKRNVRSSEVQDAPAPTSDPAPIDFSTLRMDLPEAKPPKSEGADFPAGLARFTDAFTADDPARQVITEDLVRKFYGALPARDKAILDMHVQGRSALEIGESLGMTEVAVKRVINTLRAKLSMKLAKSQDSLLDARESEVT